MTDCSLEEYYSEKKKHQMCVRLTERPTGADNFGKCGTRLKRTLIEYLEMLLGTGR